MPERGPAFSASLARPLEPTEPAREEQPTLGEMAQAVSNAALREARDYGNRWSASPQWRSRMDRIAGVTL